MLEDMCSDIIQLVMLSLDRTQIMGTALQRCAERARAPVMVMSFDLKAPYSMSRLRTGSVREPGPRGARQVG